MDTTKIKTGFVIQSADADQRGQVGQADTIDGALAGAWVLQQHIGGAVDVIDHRIVEGFVPSPRKIATVSVEWHD